MSEAVRVGDLTAHGTPIQGQGSPDVFIGNMKAWRAIPADVGGGLEEASKQVKAIMDKFPSLPSPSDPSQVATKDLTEIFQKMLDTATKAEAASGMCGAMAGVQSAFMSFQPTALSLLATYTSAAAAPAPGAEVAARLAFTAAFQAGLGTAMSAAVTAVAGSWDMNNCPAAIPGPPPHGPGLVTVGCKTIFINKMPAVVKGHKIIEASGGPNTIQVGCGNVFFGDKAPGQSTSEPADFPDDSGLGGGPVLDPATGKPVLLAMNEVIPGLLLADAGPAKAASSGPSTGKLKPSTLLLWAEPPPIVKKKDKAISRFQVVPGSEAQGGNIDSFRESLARAFNSDPKSTEFVKFENRLDLQRAVAGQSYKRVILYAEGYVEIEYYADDDPPQWRGLPVMVDSAGREITPRDPEYKDKKRRGLIKPKVVKRGMVTSRGGSSVIEGSDIVGALSEMKSPPASVELAGCNTETHGLSSVIASDTRLKAGIDIVGYQSKRDDDIDWDPDDSTMQVRKIIIGGTRSTTRSTGDTGGKTQ